MILPSLVVALALTNLATSTPILKRDAKSAAIDALLLNSNIGYEICIIAQETYLAAAALGLANNFDYCVNPLTNIPVQTSVTIIYPPAAQTNLVLTSTSSTVSINPGTVTSLTTTSTTTTTSTSTTLPTLTFTQYTTLPLPLPTVMANATIALNSTNTTSTITKAPVSSAYSTQITNSTTSAVNNSTTPAVTVTVTVTANATTTSTKILP